jgi:hypothetical protein
VIVEIAQMITKGSRLVEHLVSLEGEPSSQRVVDFVVQFAIYLQRAFGLALDASMTSSAAFLLLSRSRTPLWGYANRESWAVRLNLRFTKASYPENFFTPHSPRRAPFSIVPLPWD